MERMVGRRGGEGGGVSRAGRGVGGGGRAGAVTLVERLVVDRRPLLGAIK